MAKQATELRYAVRFRVVFKYFGQLCLVLAALSMLPLVMSLIFGDTPISLRYGIVIGGLAASGFGLARLRAPSRVQANEGMVLVALMFLFTPLVMSYPMMGSGLSFLDALELAEKAKKQNIIDMAVGFTAIMPLFQERSADLIKEKLADLFEGLDRISSTQDFSKIHRNFCQWFVKTIRLAKTEEPSSCGHAAKVLDLALKVYVYYCKMPSPAKAESLMPGLNGAIDTPILRHLFKKLEDIYGKSFPSHYLWTIKMIDKEDYDLLQKVIRQDIKDYFDDNISPVQYDDIMWRRLNR